MEGERVRITLKLCAALRFHFFFFKFFCRLTGFENTLLGFSSRIYPMVKGILNGTAAAIDTVCFGNLNIFFFFFEKFGLLSTDKIKRQIIKIKIKKKKFFHANYFMTLLLNWKKVVPKINTSKADFFQNRDWNIKIPKNIICSSYLEIN